MPSVLRGLSALLAPDRCTACGVRGRQPWCRRCATEAATLRIDRACRRCGAAPGPHGCWDASAPVTGGLTLYRYRGVVAAAVVAGKARGAWAVWSVLGDELGRAVHREVALAPDVVTWVPTDPRRARARGIDHARALGRRVAARCGAPAAALLATGPPRPDQARLPDDARRAVPDSAFRPLRCATAAHVLLVDDVLTTGGTAHAAASVLRRAGAEAVTVVTLARAGDHGLGRAAATPGRWPGPS